LRKIINHQTFIFELSFCMMWWWYGFPFCWQGNAIICLVNYTFSAFHHSPAHAWLSFKWKGENIRKRKILYGTIRQSTQHSQVNSRSRIHSLFCFGCCVVFSLSLPTAHWLYYVIIDWSWAGVESYHFATDYHISQFAMFTSRPFFDSFSRDACSNSPHEISTLIKISTMYQYLCTKYNQIINI
jgi:hypothetical protein